MLIRYLAEYFYAEYGIVASTQLERLQRAFNVFAGLFDQVGLRKNTRKTVSMACQPYQTPVRMSVEAYERRTMGTGTTFWERQQRRANVP